MTPATVLVFFICRNSIHDAPKTPFLSYILKHSTAVIFLMNILFTLNLQGI